MWIGRLKRLKYTVSSKLERYELRTSLWLLNTRRFITKQLWRLITMMESHDNVRNLEPLNTQIKWFITCKRSCGSKFTVTILENDVPIATKCMTCGDHHIWTEEQKVAVRQGVIRL